MNKIYPHLINFFSAVLLFIFTFIVVTENTGFINNNYKEANNCKPNFVTENLLNAVYIIEKN